MMNRIMEENLCWKSGNVRGRHFSGSTVDDMNPQIVPVLFKNLHRKKQCIIVNIKNNFKQCVNFRICCLGKMSWLRCLYIGANHSIRQRKLLQLKANIIKKRNLAGNTLIAKLCLRIFVNIKKQIFYNYNIKNIWKNQSK